MPRNQRANSHLFSLCYKTETTTKDDMKNFLENKVSELKTMNKEKEKQAVKEGKEEKRQKRLGGSMSTSDIRTGGVTKEI